MSETNYSPGDYRAKHNWQSAAKAAAYRKSRDASRYGRTFKEDKIVGNWLNDLPQNATILDLPCGTGRFVHLINSRGFRYTGADIAEAMLKEAREVAGPDSRAEFILADAENMPFADNSFDCVIVWRLFQHLTDATIRVKILREAARVSRRKVLVSFYHPFSFTSLRLGLKNRFSARKKQRGVVTHWQIDREGEDCGLRLIETKGFQKFISINWFACFEKS